MRDFRDSPLLSVRMLFADIEQPSFNIGRRRSPNVW